MKIPTQPLNILSLGAGVQSSTLLLMALEGEIPLFDAAIFADTGAEPQAVYDYLQWLEDQINGRFPLYRVAAGNLEQDTLDAIDQRRRKRLAQPPFYVKNTEPFASPVYAFEPAENSGVLFDAIQTGTTLVTRPDRGGMLWRACTRDYKLVPIRRKVRQLWRATHKTPKLRAPITQWIGISYDELERMKDSGLRFVTNHYYLVEQRLTREDCVRWLLSRGFPRPPKSACYFCPYRSNANWRAMKQDDPKTFGRAKAFDAELRTGKLPGVTGDAYIHRSFIPLSAVDLSTDVERGQHDFSQECEGLCGV